MKKKKQTRLEKLESFELDALTQEFDREFKHYFDFYRLSSDPDTILVTIDHTFKVDELKSFHKKLGKLLEEVK